MDPASPARPRPKALVLHVDDEQMNRDVTSMLISDFGAEALSASGAAEGIKIASEQTPDLIIMDVNMPGMDGLEACKALKSNPSTKNIPIVMLTARALKEDQDKAFAVGANDYLTKPLDVNLLFAALEKWLHKPPAQ
jgi:CheY-like chemotaxis protein